MNRHDCDGVRKVQQEGTDMSEFVDMDREPLPVPGGPIANMTCQRVEPGQGKPKIVGPDQEVWIKNQILTAISAAILVGQARRVRADMPIVSSAIDGIANGAAVEIIHTLDMEPGYVNLRKVKPE